MGADLILAFVPWESTKAKRKKFFGARLKALTDKQLDYICEDCCFDPEEGEDLRKLLQQRVDEALEDLSYDRRDTVIFRIGGEDYLFTGGMSWGDEPTDAYNSVRVLAQIFEAASEGPGA